MLKKYLKILKKELIKRVLRRGRNKSNLFESLMTLKKLVNKVQHLCEGL